MPDAAGSKIQKSVILSPLTSMHVGGPAEYFINCENLEDIEYAVSFAKKNQLPLHILGGGSNTLFSDEGYKGLVLKTGMKGISVSRESDSVHVRASGGEIFDELVKEMASQNFSGIECLSGIPGTAGAGPVQNIGAYGQEIGDAVFSVEAYDIENDSIKIFSHDECKFSYRTSIFKTEYKNKYIITVVNFRLEYFRGKWESGYPELQQYVKEKYSGGPSLEDVRSSVLDLRRKKSMVIHPDDPDSVSCGSFFMNPFVHSDKLDEIQKTLLSRGEVLDRLPVFQVSGRYKISAAFLIEKAGFVKGYEKNGAAISSKHALALVNRGGCRRSDILFLAEEIQAGVMKNFGIALEMEPVLAG